MKHMRRFVVLTFVLLALFFIKLNTTSDDYSNVETFRGAHLEQSVFYPLIAKSINDSGGLTFLFNGEEMALAADELCLNDNMQVMASLDFIREMFYTSANLYDNTEFRLERNDVEYKFYVDSVEGIAGTERVELSCEPLVLENDCYLPLEDLCKLFGYDYHWDMKSAQLEVSSNEAQTVSLPKSFDLRNKDRASTIKNQGNTQTCWAYAAYGAMESSLLPQEPVSLNPKELIDKKPYEYQDNGGGDFAMALSYLLSWQGPTVMDEKKHVQEVHFYDADDIDDIKWGVYLYGGVSTSVYINVSSIGTSSNYNPASNAYCYRGDKEPNHDVVIIGWDDRYLASHFTGDVPGDGAFICQNSWGDSFGDEGVFYVSYYDSNIGNQAVSYAKIENENNYDFIQQMDRCGWRGQIGYNKDEAWGAAVYSASDDLSLKSCGFYALDKNSTFQVYVVDKYEGLSSLAGRTLVASGTLDDAGYYTIPFLRDVSVSKGDAYAVILFIHTPEQKRPIAIEYETANMVPGSVDLSDGVSFVSKNGLDWESIEETARGNLCLKVYGDYREEEEK